MLELLDRSVDMPYLLIMMFFETIDHFIWTKHYISNAKEIASLEIF